MQIPANKYRNNLFNALKFALLLLHVGAVPFLAAGCATTETINMEPVDTPILEKWSGDYPVRELGRLPAGQQDMAAGYIGDPETFIQVWRAFMPQEILPAVDFSKNIVVFTRNTQFYNRTSILKVMLQEGTADIIAMETMSALPIEEKAAMALAVIPRHGVMAIRAGAEKLEVKPHK
jgi:hypothetical protein